MPRWVIATLLLTLSVRASAPLEGRVLPYRQVSLCAPVSSHIIDFQAQEGDTVTAGQPIARLYGRLEELEMLRAKARLERCEYEAKGVKKLYESKVIPEAKALEARYELELARLTYETAAEQVKLRTLAAPIDGLVVERNRELGEAVAPGQPVFRILDLSKVWVLCLVKADQAPALAAGRKLTVRIPHLEEPAAFSAEVSLVDPQPDGEGRLKVKLRIDNPGQRIRPGCRALVELPEAAVPGNPKI